MSDLIPHIHIAGRRIASDTAPYVIAELSANHNGKLETALRIIEEAKKVGADAVKLQTYKPDTITLDCDVLQADGGTRTAAISGSYVALVDAL